MVLLIVEQEGSKFKELVCLAACTLALLPLCACIFSTTGEPEFHYVEQRNYTEFTVKQVATAPSTSKVLDARKETKAQKARQGDSTETVCLHMPGN
jgi:hypothetical protein